MLSKQTLPDHDARLRQATRTAQEYFNLHEEAAQQIVEAYTDPNTARLDIERDQRDED